MTSSQKYTVGSFSSWEKCCCVLLFKHMPVNLEMVTEIQFGHNISVFTKCSSFNPWMVFGSVGPVFTFYQKKNHMIHISFKLRLTGLGTFSVKNIYLNTFSMTTHCTPPYTFIHVGGGVLKVWKLKVLCTFTHPPPLFLHLLSSHKDAALLQNSSTETPALPFPHILPSVLWKPIFSFSYFIPNLQIAGKAQYIKLCHCGSLFQMPRDPLLTGPLIAIDSGKEIRFWWWQWYRGRGRGFRM